MAFGRRRTGSVVCPSCNRLVGASEPRCPFCGRAAPGMFGLTGTLRKVESALALWPLVGWVCGALYIAALATDPQGLAPSGLFSPNDERLLAFGASGIQPVFRFGRWWTVLSAGWLHANLLHIVLNVYGLWQIAPAIERIYGTGRGWVIYTLSGAMGFAFSALSVFVPGCLGRVLGHGDTTVGASAALFGLLGALLHYSRRSGMRSVGQLVWSWALPMAVFGLLPGLHIDNWAHLGGFTGGWLLSYWLDPLKEERLDHLLAATLCILASAGAIVWSLVTWR
jgi:rhomboid protease GluP